MILMGVYLTKRETRYYISPDVSTNTISKMVIIKIKPESDQTSRPNYQLTENAGSE